MAKIMFTRVNGIALDITNPRDNWPVPPGYLTVPDDGTLHTQQSLSDPVAWAAKVAAEQAAAQRKQVDTQESDSAKQDNAVTSMLDRTPAQIATFIDNQATDLAGVRTVLKLFARVLVIVARRVFR